ncbi:MAG: SRPBCC domain-containing protein [Acidimicrobiales bacterium]
MTSDKETTVEGTLHSAGGVGVVRMKGRYATDIEDLWSAITDPQRLVRWYGKVEGDFRVGGEFTEYVSGSQNEGRGRIEVCDPPRKLRVSRTTDDGPKRYSTAELVADGDLTILTIEVHGMPLEDLYAFGGGWQLHVEDLATYLAGHDDVDFGAAWLTRWEALDPSYLEMVVEPLEH